MHLKVKRLVKSTCFALAVLLLAGLIAGCAANLPCPVGENEVEQARAKCASADKQLEQASAKVSELEAQVQSKQALIQELEAKIAELEQALAN